MLLPCQITFSSFLLTILATSTHELARKKWRMPEKQKKETYWTVSTPSYCKTWLTRSEIVLSRRLVLTKINHDIKIERKSRFVIGEPRNKMENYTVQRSKDIPPPTTCSVSAWAAAESLVLWTVNACKAYSQSNQPILSPLPIKNTVLSLTVCMNKRCNLSNLFTNFEG